MVMYTGYWLGEREHETDTSSKMEGRHLRTWEIREARIQEGGARIQEGEAGIQEGGAGIQKEGAEKGGSGIQKGGSGIQKVGTRGQD